MNWTDERIEKLKQLWTEGLSASEIAAQLGGVSRNAVIGKVSRLNMPGRAKVHLTPSEPPSTRTARVQKSKPDPVAIAKLNEIIDRAPPPVADSIPAPKSLMMTLMELERNDCRWPTGEHADITFCGHNIENGKSYCPYHVRLARGRGTPSERRADRELVRAA